MLVLYYSYVDGGGQSLVGMHYLPSVEIKHLSLQVEQHDNGNNNKEKERDRIASQKQNAGIKPPGIQPEGNSANIASIKWCSDSMVCPNVETTTSKDISSKVRFWASPCVKDVRAFWEINDIYNATTILEFYIATFSYKGFVKMAPHIA